MTKRAASGPPDEEADVLELVDAYMFKKHLYPLLSLDDKLSLSRTCHWFYKTLEPWRKRMAILRGLLNSDSITDTYRHELTDLWRRAVNCWKMDNWLGLHA
jgi:hypothetical protein